MKEKLYGFDKRNENAFRCYVPIDAAINLAENFSDCIEKLMKTSKESNDESKKLPCMSAGILLGHTPTSSTSKSKLFSNSPINVETLEMYGPTVEEAFPLFGPSYNRENSIKAYEHYAYLSRGATEILKGSPGNLHIEWDFSKQILKEVVSFFESMYKENFSINLHNECVKEYKQRTPEVLQRFLSKVYKSHVHNIIFDLRITVNHEENMPYILFIVRNEKEKYWYGPLDVNMMIRHDFSLLGKFKTSFHRNPRVSRL